MLFLRYKTLVITSFFWTVFGSAEDTTIGVQTWIPLKVIMPNITADSLVYNAFEEYNVDSSKQFA